MKKTHINIHHTAMYSEDDTSEQFDAVNEAHRVRWDGATRSSLGFHGGYHYIVERSGAVQQFRTDAETGAHNNKGIRVVNFIPVSANYYALGITFAGNMSRQNLTEAQIKAGAELIVKLQRAYNIPDDNVLPHRAYTATQCPGNNIPDKVWPYIKEMYESQTDKPTWQEEAAEWAVENGISQNGDRPNDQMTRAEVWQTLKNYHNNL
jgi:hypothetical protein